MPESVRPADVAAAGQLKEIGVELSRLQTGSHLCTVQALQDKIDTRCGELTLEQQGDSFELWVHVIEHALQLETTGSPSGRRRPHRESRPIKSKPRGAQIERVVGAIGVRPVN